MCLEWVREQGLEVLRVGRGTETSEAGGGGEGKGRQRGRGVCGGHDASELPSFSVPACPA